MNYTHATRHSLRSPREKRYQIYVLKKMGHTQSEIASVLERSESTISRKIETKLLATRLPPYAEEMLAQDWNGDQLTTTGMSNVKLCRELFRLDRPLITHNVYYVKSEGG